MSATGTEHKEHGFRKKKKLFYTSDWKKDSKYSPLDSLGSLLISMAVPELYKERCKGLTKDGRET